MEEFGLTPKGQLRALPAPSYLNCDTSSHQLLHTERSTRQLHPTLGRTFRRSLAAGDFRLEPRQVLFVEFEEHCFRGIDVSQGQP